MTPIPNKFMEEAKRLVFCLIDEENAKVGIHIHTSLDEMEESIAISLQAAEERGRKAGRNEAWIVAGRKGTLDTLILEVREATIEEAAKVAEGWIQPVDPHEWVPAGECGTATHNATPINIAAEIRNLSLSKPEVGKPLRSKHSEEGK